MHKWKNERREGGQDTDRTHHSKKDADDYDKMRTACTSQEKKGNTVRI